MVSIALRHDSVFRPGFRTKQEVVAYQNRRLRAVIDHAYWFVPYYRKLFDQNGISPGSIRTIEDLQRIPVSSKKDLQLAGVSARMSSAFRGIGMLERRTSGSTGEEFTIRRTWLEEWILNNFRRRAWRYYGVRRSDRIAYITLARPETPKDSRWMQRLVRLIRFYPRTDINGFLSANRILAELESLQPDFITALPSVLSQVAREILSGTRHRIRPRIVSAGGELLTPLMRRQIEEAFGVPVYSTYGTQEFNLIAWECKEGSDYHIGEDSVIFEIEKEGKPAAIGESGEVILTGLHSFAMPFLRYRIGDVVTRGQDHCSCGSPFSTIRDIQGRMIDTFRLPGNRIVHPWHFIFRILRKFNWIRKYQLLQEREDLITLHVVPYVEPSEEQMQNVREVAAEVFGEEVEFKILLVPEIPYEKTGKFRVCRSLVDSQYDQV